ncbi:MAG: TetR/AcrR family transcriptional regulator [Myxococcales bacterium]|nr:TetR/AcrR family transcriptional regulator [Myxococcales bacterium]
MTPRREKRRRELLDAARDIFAEKGFVAATVDDIVGRTGVARGTFYLYFDDKLQVFGELVSDFFARVAGSIRPIELGAGAPTPREQLRANLGRVVSLCLAEPGNVKIAFSTAFGVDAALDERLASFYASLHTFMDETLETGQRIGLIRAGDRRLMVSIAIGGFEQLLQDAVSGAVPSDEAELVDALMAFLESGLLV